MKAKRNLHEHTVQKQHKRLSALRQDELNAASIAAAAAAASRPAPEPNAEDLDVICFFSELLIYCIFLMRL